MRTTKITMLAVAVLLMAINACKKEESTTTTPTPTPVDVIPSAYKKIGETYVIGASAKAVIYADKELFVGYNKLYVAMYDSATNSRLDDGHFDIEPMMDMGTMQHGSPFEVEEIAKPTDKFWKAQVVFTMASTSSASWMLHLHFHNHKNDLEGEGELKVEVKSPTVPVVKSIVAKADNNANLFVSLVSLTKPVEGLNNFEIAIHKMESMQSFPAVEDYTVEIEPTMPSMGHGSPNNVNPVHVKNGHYVGKVNFTMVGLWRVKVILKKNGNVIDDTISFDITL